jgi:hypothetical protein
MPSQTTRREALVTVAASVAGSAAIANAPQIAAAQQAYRPQSFSQEQFDLVTSLVEMIIPSSDTPGAAAAGVDRYIDQELAANSANKVAFQAGLKLLAESGFAGKSNTEKVALLTDFSQASGPRGEFFRVLKNMTLDGYYSTEIGLVQELGYQGGGYLREFPGCQHEEKL